MVILSFALFEISGFNLDKIKHLFLCSRINRKYNIYKCEKYMHVFSDHKKTKCKIVFLNVSGGSSILECLERK